MRVVLLQNDLYGYLQHVVQSYARSGVDPEEGLALFHLNTAIKEARNVDDEKAKPSAGQSGSETEL